MTTLGWKPLGAALLVAAVMLQAGDDGAVKKAEFTDIASPRPPEPIQRQRKPLPPINESGPDDLPAESVPLPLPTPTRSGADVFIRPLVVPQCQIRMPEEIHIPAEIAGVIAKMAVEEGAVVRRNDVLAQLDDRVARLKEESKRRNVENRAPVDKAARKVDHFNAQLRRSEKLKKENAISQEEVEIAAAQAAITVEEHKDEQQKMLLLDIEHEEAQESLNRHTIRSPVNGIVTQRLKHQGEAVQAMEPILHVIRTDRVKIQGQIDSRYVDRLKEGMRLEVWPEKTEGERSSIAHSAPIRCVRILPGDRRIAFGGDDGRIVVVDLATNNVERELKVSSLPVRGLAVSAAEPNQLVSCSDDGAIRFWNLADGLEVRPVLRAPREGEKPVLAVCLDPKNALIGWTGHSDGRILQWDFANGMVTRSFTLPGGDSAHINDVTCLTLSPDGETLLSVGGDKAVRWWKLASGELLRPFENRSAPAQKDVRQLNFSPDGLEIPYNSDALVQFKKLADGASHDVLESPQQSFASFVWMTPAPGLVLTTREDGEIQLWQRAKDHRPARLARVFRGHRTDALVQQVDFAASGRYFVTACSDRTVKVWSMPTVQELEAERLGAKVTFVDPQAGPTGASAFHAEVDNRRGVLRGNTTASVVVYP